MNQRINSYHWYALYLQGRSCFRSLILAIFLLSAYGLQNLNAEVSNEILNNEIVKRLDRVQEFRKIRELAQEMGVKAYLFGGTAAAYAHYVHWDLLRESGDQRFQPDHY